MPRDYTGADFILRGLPSTRERQEAIAAWQEQQERERYREIQAAEYQRQQETRLRVQQIQRQTWDSLQEEWRRYYTSRGYDWLWGEQIPKEELEIKDPVLRRVASLQRRFKSKTLRKTNVKPIPLP